MRLCRFRIFLRSSLRPFVLSHRMKPTWSALKKRWSNLLLHGDNKEILSTLLVNGFRGKVDLIYIDPPFDSGANYVRKVSLRAEKTQWLEKGSRWEKKSSTKTSGQTTPTSNTMYARLILMKELLSDQGSLYLHCDWRKSHHLRLPNGRSVWQG